MMFVDESGDNGFPKEGDWERFGGTLYFARVGVIIHGWRWKAWNEHLINFKKNRGLMWDAEIKASDIRDGNGAFKGWVKERREQFLCDLLDFIGGQLDITLLGIFIDKTKIRTSSLDRYKNPQIRSLELLLERYNYFLNNQRDKSGIVILDPTREPTDDNLRYFQSFLLAKSRNLTPLHIVEGTFFAKSHTSNMIQIADVCSNIFYRHNSRNEKDEFNRISKRFWRFNARLKGYGIKYWP